MSSTVIYKVPWSGGVTVYVSIRNAWLGAYNVWTEMSKYYLGEENLPKDKSKLWNLSKLDSVPLGERIVLASTFDNVMVRRENLISTADAMDKFCEKFDGGSLGMQGQALRELAHEETCFAVCWNQTSVNGSAWEVSSDEYNPSVVGSDETRAYDVSIDTGHWFLFDDLNKE